jgi:succinyl-diaminopimelate desuccinylase
MPPDGQNPGVPGQDLAARTLELVDVPSESRHEDELAGVVRAAVPLEPLYDDDLTLLFAPPRTGRQLVVLAGHLDTVPANGNLPGRIEDGRVHGLGASDMKGGLAVMVELARWAAGASGLAFDPAFLFFPREEISVEHSPLPRLFDTGLVDDAALVVVLEPTDNELQLGCVGNLHARLVFHGRSAHTARPWLGVNAIDLAVEGLRAVAGLPPHDVEVEGLPFREVLSLTRIAGGLADNVVPDRVEATLNFRYAPNRTRADAEARLRELVGDDVEILSHSSAASVALGNPLVQRLRDIGGFAVTPKQAWTPVAQFAERGLDAVNFGPGATRFAHTRDEQVEVAALERCFDALRAFLTP